MPKEIKLTQGKVALVGDEDYEFLNQWKWFAQSNGDGNWYAARWGRENGKRKIIRMHNVILPTSSGFIPDHKNGNGLDNRQSNLRLCTPTGNMCNSRKIKKGSSWFKGVSWCNRDRVWRAKIGINRKTICLGSFNSEIKAAIAYDKGAREYHGDFASLNFIEV